MKHTVLASKKNVIVLSVVVIIVALMLASYHKKKARIDKQVALGGQIEVVSQNKTFPRSVFEFVDSHSLKNTYMVDLKTTLALPSGAFESNVRIIDWKYPILGAVLAPPADFKIVFSEEKKQIEVKVAETLPVPVILLTKTVKGVKNAPTRVIEKTVLVTEKTYGVVVNQAFLDKTGMKINDIFRMNDSNYQLRGVLQALPDDEGQKLMSAPLLCLKHFQVPKGMYDAATSSTYRVLVNKIATNAEWQKNFKKNTRDARVVIRRADE